MIRRWLQATAYWSALVLVIAALTHLVSILALPYRSADTAYARVARAAGRRPLTSVVVASEERGPDQDPALVTSVCLYDLRQGPIAITLDVPSTGFAALSVADRYGRMLYGLTNRSAAHDQLALTILSSVQVTRRSAASEAAATDVRVESTEPEGFVVAQWLATAPSERPAAEAGVAHLSCRPAQ